MVNKKTTPKIAKIGSRAMKGKKVTPKEKKSLGASVVAQAAGKKKTKSKR